MKPRGIASKAFERVYWPYLPVVIVIGLMLGFGNRNGALSQAISLAQPDQTAQSITTSQLLAKTNHLRSQAGLTQLSGSPKLAVAAEAKANDMAKRNYWSHDTPEGTPPWLFVNRQDYSYQKLGENLAAGFSDESATVNAWLASSTHRQNMLDKDFSEVGFGTATSRDFSAAGGGPMIITVAYYAKPGTSAAGAVAVKGAVTESKTSHAQLALASLPIAGLATNLVTFTAVAALFIWLTRHIRSIRLAVSKGEKFVIRHPLFDVGLLIIVALAYILSRTAGIIH